MYVVKERLFNLGPLESERAELTADTGAPSTTEFFTDQAVGSVYTRKVAAGHTQLYVKVGNNDRADDWVCVEGIISRRFLYSEFTDGGAAAGTLSLGSSLQIPAGAEVTKSTLLNVTGFAGNTSATIVVGDGSDVDRYNTGTPSVFTTAGAVALGVPSGTRDHTAAATVTVTITGATDFTAINAGAATLHIFYRF